MTIKSSVTTSLKWIFRLTFTYCAFVFGMRLGKIHSLYGITPCPIVFPEKIEILQIDAGVDVSSLPKCNEKKVYDHCSMRPDRDETHLHLEHGSIPENLFGHLHHPSSPTKWSFVLTQEQDWPNKNSLIKKCQEIYMTRTGSRSSQPNKCVAVAKVPEEVASLVHHSHRIGYTALLTNQYLSDFSRPHTLHEEKELMPPMLKELPSLINEFRQKMGSPINADGTRKAAIVMVANEGVMDLLLNFMCSAEGAQIDLKTVMVFVGAKQYVRVVENMGGNAIYRCTFSKTISYRN